MFTAEQKKALDAKLDKSNVKKNPRGFDYVEGWHAIAEANRIFGFDGWDRQTLVMRQLGEPQDVAGKWRVAYHCRVRISVTAGERVIIRDGSGYGSGINKDIRDAHESAIKEAETDAMKRGLMTFGNPFGLALYDKEQANVDDGRGEPQTSRQPPAEPSAYDDLATDLIDGLERCKTVEALEDYSSSRVEDYDSLPQKQKDRVNTRYKTLKAKLTPAVRRAA